MTELERAEYDLIQAVEADDLFAVLRAATRFHAWRTAQPDWGDPDVYDDGALIIEAGECLGRAEY
jgi:hypothetical protein